MDSADITFAETEVSSVQNTPEAPALVNSSMDISPETKIVPSSKRREESHLTLKQIQSLTNAFTYADSVGKSLNAALDITWSDSARWSEGDVQQAQTYVLHRISSFLNAKGIGFYCIWTREVGNRLGIHVHIMIHLPATLRDELYGLIVAMGGFNAYGVRLTACMNTDDMRAGKFRYIAKAIKESDSFAFGSSTRAEISGRYRDLLRINAKPGGRVPFKRAGTSETLVH